MKWSTATALFLLAVAGCTGRSAAEFNECLGVKISDLPSIAKCELLYDACEAGVSKLNKQLKKPVGNLFHPVSLVSATKSIAKRTNATSVALLVQLAPIDRCVYTTPAAPASGGAASTETCSFDMNQVEIYSILLMHEEPNQWNLDGYKHHALSVEERTQIVSEYKTGNFYGSNLAIGIFDTPNLPAQSVSDSSDKSFSRSPLGIFAVLASATVSIGLLFHHRRRLHNGYAPIVVTKRGQLQGKPVGNLSYQAASKSASSTEENSLKQETNERFAV